MKKANAIIIILTILIVLFVVNFLAARHPLRVDLTKNNIYTLSDATRKVLGSLDDVITIRAYFTENPPPALEPMRRDVDDMLSEFKGAAGNRLQVEFIDPGSSPLEEQKAAMLGIPPVQLNVVERDKQEVAKVYLGMAVLFGDRQQVIPVIRDLGSLEYQLTEAIIKVSAKELPKVAWWEGKSGGDVQGNEFSFIRKAIENRYGITNVDGKVLADLVPEKYSALVVVSPRQFTNDELFALDQYIMRGGRVLFLIDRVEVGRALNAAPIDTNVADLAMHYGATVEDALVLDQSNAMAAFSGGVVTYHLPYPYWPDVRRDQFNQKDPIVSGLESAVMPWTSPLVLAAPEGDKAGAEIVARSSRFSTVVSGKDAKLDPQAASEALIGGKKESRPLIAILSGPLPSYFSDGKNAAPKGREVVKNSEQNARIFVAGSSRWVSDSALQMFPQNAALFENALDAFAMGDMLIGIRSREVGSRPIAVMSDGARLAIKYANLAIGPAAVVVLGLILFLFRRSKRRAVQMAYGRQNSKS